MSERKRLTDSEKAGITHRYTSLDQQPMGIAHEMEINPSTVRSFISRNSLKRGGKAE